MASNSFTSPQDSFSVGWTPQADIIKPSRRPPSQSASQQQQEQNLPQKPAKKQILSTNDNGYQIGYTDEPVSPTRPCKKLGPPQVESKEMSTPKKRPGTGKDGSFSVGWTKPDPKAQPFQPLTFRKTEHAGGKSTFSVGWTGVPESIRNCRKPAPSTARNSDTVFQEEDSASSPSKPSKRISARPENPDGYSISWSDTPSNQTIRPSRRLGPSGPRESVEDPSPPSPSKKRIPGGEASFSVGWTKPDNTPKKFLTAHQQAPGGNSSISIAWNNPSPSDCNTEVAVVEAVDHAVSVTINPLPYSIGIIVHCASPQDSNQPTISLLPTLLSSLTHSGISHTQIFIHYISSLTSLPYTTQKLRSKVDGILVFSINLLGSSSSNLNKDPTSPLLDSLQQLSLKYNYPAIVPGFVLCQNTPESILEMKGIMKHVMKDWATHLVAILQVSHDVIPLLSVQEEEAANGSSSSPTSSSSVIADDNISELTELSVLPVEEAVAGVQTNSRERDVLGSRKKRGTGGGGSSIVLG